MFADLAHVDAEDVPQGFAQSQSGQNGDGIARREQKQVTKFDPPRKPEYAPQGDDENGLELDRHGG